MENKASLIKKLLKKIPFLLLIKAAPRIIDTVSGMRSNGDNNAETEEMDKINNIENIILEEAKSISNIEYEIELLKKKVESRRFLIYILIALDIIILIIAIAIMAKIY
ncbi:MAG: hypothetical protein KA059_02470 [Elusimicrobiales bacterium]|nr:hypothetical protein [Elusimicrobiales bacterium]